MSFFQRASEAEKRLLPGGRFDGPTGWLIAIMTFVMVLVATAGIALSNAAGSLERSAKGDLTIQLSGGAERSEAMVNALGDLPGVVTVSAVPEEELRASLSEWLGPDIARDSAELSLPLLVDVELDEDGSAEAVAKTANAIAPGATVIRHADRLGSVLGGLEALVAVTLLMVLLVAGGTATAVVLATRSALDTHRATLSVMHGIGATDEQIARLFQRRIAFDALAGGISGALAALLLVYLFTRLLLGDVEMLVGSSLIGIGEIALLLLLPLALAGLATWVARRTVLATLSEQL